MVVSCCATADILRPGSHRTFRQPADTRLARRSLWTCWRDVVWCANERWPCVCCSPPDGRTRDVCTTAIVPRPPPPPPRRQRQDRYVGTRRAQGAPTVARWQWRRRQCPLSRSAYAFKYLCSHYILPLKVIYSHTLLLTVFVCSINPNRPLTRN